MHRFKLAWCLTGLAIFSCQSSPGAKRDQFLKLGVDHRQHKDYPRALIDFRNAEQVMPADAEAHYQIGLTLLEMGSLQPAALELQKSLDIDPKHAGARAKMAEVTSLANDPDIVTAGRRQVEQILTAMPDDPETFHAVVLTRLRLEDRESTLPSLRQALQKAPPHLQAALTLALSKLQNLDPDGADRVIRDSAASADGSVSSILLLGRYCLLAGKLAAAEKELRRALQLDPQFGPALASLGCLLARQGRTEAEAVFLRCSKLAESRYRALYPIYLLQKGEGDVGIAEFERQYRADTADREARTRLLSAQLQVGRTGEAAKLLADVIRATPNDAGALMERGELFLLEGQIPEAAADLTEALRFRPDSAEAHFIMARIHRARGASDADRRELAEAIRLNPNLLAARLELAHAFELVNAPDRALAVLDETPSQDARSLAVIIERNTALYGVGNYDEMRKGVDQGRSMSQDVRLLVQDGLLKLKLQDFKGGRAAFEEVLRRDSKYWIALEALALSYLTQNDLSEATAIVRRYTSALPDSPQAQRFLGAWLARTGDHFGARVAFNAAKSMAPKFEAVDLELAKLDTAEGRFPSARATVAGFLQKHPHSVAALMLAAEIEERVGAGKSAMAFYERVLNEDPANVAALNNLSFTLADSSIDPDRALTLAQKAKRLAPDNKAIDDTLGWAFYNKGLYQSAVDYLSKAEVEGTPARKCRLAMACIRLGDVRRARRILDSVSKLNASGPEVSRALELLRAQP